MCLICEFEEQTRMVITYHAEYEAPTITVVHPTALLEGRMDRHKANLAFHKAVVSHWPQPIGARAPAFLLLGVSTHATRFNLRCGGVCNRHA